MSIATAVVAVDSTVKAGYRDLLAALKATGLLAGGTRSMLPHVELAAGDPALLAELVAFVSAFTTLLPGDVILTGTPEGVGRIEPGDVVDVTVDGIGTLSNPVVAAQA